MAACLAAAPSAAASHGAAAHLWDLASFRDEIVEISIANRARLVLPGVVVHRPRDLARIDRSVRRGIPVTSPTRTLIDLAGTAHVDLVEEALDDALRRRLTSVARLRRRLDELARRGRPGIVAIRALVDARRGRAPAESPLETDFLRLVRAARLPRPVSQYEIRLDGRLIARVDFAYPEAKLAIELDGYEHHSGRARFELDRKRCNVLTALRWTVIHITWALLRNEPDDLIRLIAAVLAERAAGLPDM